MTEVPKRPWTPNTDLKKNGVTRESKVKNTSGNRSSKSNDKSKK